MSPRIDHVGLDVTDYERSKDFYERALAPLGMRCIMEPAPGIGGFGADFPFFWIGNRGRAPQSGVHVAIRVGAFVLDPDGNNIEAVCHGK